MSNPIQDPQGPDWPLGLITVPTPGTPVGIMSLVDPSGRQDPANPTAAGVREYTSRAQQIMFQGFTAGTGRGVGGTGTLVPNTGNVYIVRKSYTATDTGSVVAVLSPGQTVFLASAPTVEDVFSGYRYALDADVASDGALVTLLIF